MGTDLSALPGSREGGIPVPSFSVSVAALPETNALNPGAWGSAPNRLASFRNRHVQRVDAGQTILVEFVRREIGQIPDVALPVVVINPVVNHGLRL